MAGAQKWLSVRIALNSGGFKPVPFEFRSTPTPSANRQNQTPIIRVPKRSRLPVQQPEVHNMDVG